jgi:probable addiction module antidote protein
MIAARRAILKARAFDAAKYRSNPRAVAKYLNDALTTRDPVLATKAIGIMVRAQGVTKLAKKTGRRRDSLYLMFNGESSPAFATVLNVLIALDIKLVAKPAAAKSSLGLKAKPKS